MDSSNLQFEVFGSIEIRPDKRSFGATLPDKSSNIYRSILEEKNKSEVYLPP